MGTRVPKARDLSRRGKEMLGELCVLHGMLVDHIRNGVSDPFMRGMQVGKADMLSFVCKDERVRNLAERVACMAIEKLRKRKGG